MPIWEITVESELSAQHRLRGVPKDKGAMHAHRWTIRASVRARELTRAGWVLDFNEVSEALARVLKPYKDRFLNERPPFDSINPTREKIARVLAEKLAAELHDERVVVHRIDIIEGARCASYIED
jgi:6-pyruvoyltetrahydropterin/6-carboxytetrahydropterin synthase